VKKRNRGRTTDEGGKKAACFEKRKQPLRAPEKELGRKKGSREINSILRDRGNREELDGAKTFVGMEKLPGEYCSESRIFVRKVNAEGRTKVLLKRPAAKTTKWWRTI